MLFSTSPRTPSRRRRIPQTLLVLLLAQRQADSFQLPANRIAHQCSTLRPGVLTATRTCRSQHHHRLLVVNPSIENSSGEAPKPQKQSYNWNKQNFAIAVPALIGMMADPLLSLMDTAYVGRIGATELAALGACTSIFHLAFNAFRATTAATTSIVASNLLEDEESAKQVTATSLWFGWWVGIAVAATLYGGGAFFLKSMGVSRSSALYPAASGYLYARSWAAPAVLLMLVAEGAFRGYGDTVIPLLASLVAASINLVLDPLLMFQAGWGVKGAAAATGLAQVGAAMVYGYHLIRRRMLPAVRRRPAASKTKTRPSGVIQTILGANIAMLMKQGSLLLGWAYATARTTRLGATQVAAHQVALSVWLIFAFILDGCAVSAQVLMSRAYAARDRPQVRSLFRYMTQFAIVQGIASMVILDGIDFLVPRMFTPDKVIQGHLHQLMMPLAFQQVLVSLTLVMESLAIGTKQFQILGVGSVLSTIASVYVTSRQMHVKGIWAYGITTLFAVRLVMALLALLRASTLLGKQQVKGDHGA